MHVSHEASPHGRSQSKSEVQSVRRACQLLDCLTDHPHKTMSTLELSIATGLDRTVVHRLLRTLTLEGFLEEEHGQYHLGSRALGLAQGYLAHTRIRETSLPYALELHNELLERPWIVALGVPAGGFAVLIEQLWKPQAPLDMLLETGTRMPLDASAVGRCLLAYGYQSPKQEPDGDWPTSLKERLEAIRQAGGVEWSSSEIRPGISALAAVILNHDANPVGAIAVSGPEMGEHLARDSELAARLRRAAAAIGRMVT